MSRGKIKVMEHGLILLIEAILAIDRNMQKPVRAVIPNVGRLRTDPKPTLAEGEIVFGPRRAYAVSAVVGIIVAGFVLAGFAIAALDRPVRRPIEPWYFVAAGIGVLLSGAATTALVLRWSRGGSAVLQPQGVQFVHRGRSVFCPWSLFQAPGTPYQPDHKRVILPANDETPVALTDADGNVTAHAANEVKSKPLVGGADGQVALHDLYEVKLAEFAELLLHLGRLLGDGQFVTANGVTYSEPIAASQPIATAQSGGWLRIRLTRLPFPRVCLACGTYSRETIQHTLDQRHRVHIEMPLCTVCQSERRRRRRRTLLIGGAIGLAPGVLAMVVGKPFMALDDLIVLCLILFLFGPFVGVLVGMVARDANDLVKVKEYSAGTGTVLMRLRPMPGTPAFRDALGLTPESEPAKEEAAV
jgi:hypothetical protein